MAMVMFAMVFAVSAVFAVCTMLLSILLAVFIELVQDITGCHELKSSQ